MVVVTEQFEGTAAVAAAAAAAAAVQASADVVSGRCSLHHIIVSSGAADEMTLSA